MESLIRLREAAKTLGVHPETLRRWDRSGKFKAILINMRGDRRYKQSDLEEFIQKHEKD